MFSMSVMPQAGVAAVIVVALALVQTSAAADTKVPTQGGNFLSKDCLDRTNSLGTAPDQCETGTAFDFKCGEGSYVNSFDMTYNNAITSLGPFTCTRNASGTDTVKVNERAGDSAEGKQNTFRSNAGFHGVALRSGDLIDSLDGVGPNREFIAPGLVGGSGGGGTQFVECPGTDYKVPGFHGAGTPDNVITVGVYCGIFGKAEATAPQP